jgi:hypothetical protein
MSRACARRSQHGSWGDHELRHTGIESDGPATYAIGHHDRGCDADGDRTAGHATTSATHAGHVPTSTTPTGHSRTGNASTRHFRASRACAGDIHADNLSKDDTHADDAYAGADPTGHFHAGGAATYAGHAGRGRYGTADPTFRDAFQHHGGTSLAVAM